MATTIPNENVDVLSRSSRRQSSRQQTEAEIGAHAKHNVSVALQRLPHAEQTPTCENL
jgi:hypothetical protein